MGVFSSNGVVGIIHNSSNHFSLVKSVLTSDINIDVMIDGDGAFGLLKWNGKDPRFATIYGITNDIEIPIGSKVITRGGGGIFPKGISVGQVKSVKSIEGKPVWRIQIELSEKYPEKDPQWINFVELRSLVMSLDDFDDDHDRCNERILESIQQNWIEEKD